MGDKRGGGRGEGRGKIGEREGGKIGEREVKVRSDGMPVALLSNIVR